MENFCKNLYIHIIESPSSDDLLLKRQEGGLISEALKLMNIQSQHLLAVNKNALVLSFLSVFNIHLNTPGLIPIIHISAHGCKEGIFLTNGKLLTWHELCEILTPLNKALNGYLLLFMSSCEGLYAASMAFKEGKKNSFCTLIGNIGKPTWAETLVFFTTIYHLLGKATHIKEAVDAAKAASGNT